MTVLGPSGPSATQTCRRPISSQVPSTSSPSGDSREHSRSQTEATWDSSYWRSTLAARISWADPPPSSGTSKPPRRKVSSGGAAYGSAAATRAGSISMPTTRTSGRTVRSRPDSSTAVHGAAPYPRSTAVGGRSADRSAGPSVWAIQRSIRRSRLVLVVPRVTVPTGRRAGPRAGAVAESKEEAAMSLRVRARPRPDGGRPAPGPGALDGRAATGPRRGRDGAVKGP